MASFHFQVNNPLNANLFTYAKKLGVHAVEIAHKEKGNWTCGVEKKEITSCQV